MLPDLITFSLAAGAIYVVSRSLMSVTSVFTVIVPVLGLLAVAFAISGLYFAIAMHPAQELRAVTVMTLIVFLAYTFTLTLIEVDLTKHTIALAVMLVLVIVLVPIGRAFSRIAFSQTEWWGVPAVVIGSESAGNRVIQTLDRWPELGLRPVALLHDDLDGIGDAPPSRLNMTRLGPYMARAHHIPYAIVAMPKAPHSQQIELLGRCSKFFERVIVVNDAKNILALWSLRQRNAVLTGYEIEHAMRSKLGNIAKRAVDLVGSALGLLFLAPLFLTLAVLIKLDSRGPILFRQVRMTREGRCFKVIKFRSMHVKAEEKLATLLAENSELEEEYQKYHKLKDDPRVTRVGKFLRRSSLDELPQLWNVIRGDLSLVGPRAYTPAELDKMQGYNHVVLQNRPGITGLWQVSGRNELSFEERLLMDVHYVFNWTPWLDLYIIARTPMVLWSGAGVS